MAAVEETNPRTRDSGRRGFGDHFLRGMGRWYFGELRHGASFHIVRASSIVTSLRLTSQHYNRYHHGEGYQGQGKGFIKSWGPKVASFSCRSSRERGRQDPGLCVKMLNHGAINAVCSNSPIPRGVCCRAHPAKQLWAELSLLHARVARFQGTGK